MSSPDQAQVSSNESAYLERSTKRRRRFSFTAKVLLTLFLLGLAGYQADVYENRAQRFNAEISVNVHDAPRHANNTRSAIVFFDGFGSYDSDHLASTLEPAVRKMVDGEVWSVSYGNAPLASERISELIAQKAEERDRYEIDLVGYSMGGIISLEAAAFLSAHPEITIRSITLISTPDGIPGLRPYQRQELEFSETLVKIPGAQYSTPLRFLGEVYFMRDRYTTGTLGDRLSGLWDALSQANLNVSGPKFPGTWLLVDQAFAVAGADLQAEMATISENTLTGKARPTLLYLGTQAPAHDYMVNDKKSSLNICRYAMLQSLHCTRAEVLGAVHTMPAWSRDEYSETFERVSESVQEDIDRSYLLYRTQLMEDLTGRLNPEYQGGRPDFGMSETE